MVGGRYTVRSLGWHCLLGLRYQWISLLNRKATHTIFTTLILGIIKDPASL